MRFLVLRLALAATVALTGPAVSATAQAHEFTFKLHHFLAPASHGPRKMLEPWARIVEEQSQGRIKIDMYPAMQLGGTPAQLMDQVRDGIVDIAWVLPGYTPGRFTMTEVFELPFMHSSAVATTMALNEFVQRHGEEYAEYKIIAMHVHAGQLFHSRDPIHRVEDLEGLKIRTPTRTGAWLIEAMGAVPIGAPVPQIPELLSRKVVDAVMIPFEVTVPLKVAELVRHHTELDDPMFRRINTSTFIIAMNKDSYARLPDDLKKVIDDNSGMNVARWIGESWDDAEADGVEVARQNNNEIYALPPAEVAKLRAMVEKPVIERWIGEMNGKGRDGAALVAEARALLRKYSQ
jgi:TRAP-type C4-dicarboxylate transport system substrate-binding protein